MTGTDLAVRVIPHMKEAASSLVMTTKELAAWLLRT
ncbi:hypothetical protein BJ987_003383 [Nocardia goodfellowii]|uniref:Uncharacterized protein n=1 Tax=Nocardia goodfellowii TaxID=882446 RepID=A0ABS4QFM9_9NOCA|nr:hypothetical protein [Nocardia goodfellowii]